MNNEPSASDQPPETTETLLFQTSPYGNLDAIVEHDGRVVYFYLNESATGNRRFGTRACWVRNLVDGPYVLNESEMKSGQPPLLPRTWCAYSDGKPLFDPDRLEIVWLEEGNGAALLEHAAAPPGAGNSGPEILAIIPPWSGLEGFHGYARDCVTESPLCWPVPDNDRLTARIDRSRDFWNGVAQEKENSFAKLQQQILETYSQQFNDEGKYFAIDGGQFPPRGMIVFEEAETLTALTVGMSLCAQPAVELFTDSPADFRRIELGIRVGKATGHALPVDSARDALLQQLSGLAGMPWKTWTWMGPGHTADFQCFGDVCGPELTSALLVRNEPASLKSCPPAIAPTVQQNLNEAPEFELAAFRGDRVNLLWLVPVSDEHRASISSAE